jgi:hypothetical protein
MLGIKLECICYGSWTAGSESHGITRQVGSILLTKQRITAAAEAHTDETTLDFSIAAVGALLKGQRTGTAAILCLAWALKATGLARADGLARLCILGKPWGQMNSVES